MIVLRVRFPEDAFKLRKEEDSCWNLRWTDEEEPIKDKEKKQSEIAVAFQEGGGHLYQALQTGQVRGSEFAIWSHW